MTYEIPQLEPVKPDVTRRDQLPEVYRTGFDPELYDQYQPNQEKHHEH